MAKGRRGPAKKLGLPQGVCMRGENYRAEIWWGGKMRYIARFATVEKASAAFQYMLKERSHFQSAAAADASSFDAARAKAIDAVGGATRKKSQLPQGVQETKIGNYISNIWWGGKSCCIATFATVEKASAAYQYVLKERSRFQSAAAADESSFEAARAKAIQIVGGAITRRGLSRRQKGIVKDYIKRNINSEGKLKTPGQPGQILSNLVTMVASDEDDRAVLKKQIQSFIYKRCISIRKGHLQNDDTSSVVSGATYMSFVGVDPEEVLGSTVFGRVCDMDASSSSDDDGSIDSTMSVLGAGDDAGDDAISNLATHDDRKPAAKRGYAEI